MNEQSSQQSAGLIKRLLAIIYDSLLIAALLFIAEILPLALNHGEAVSRDNGWLMFYLLHPLYLLVVCFLFLGWFWTHGGQTLGMKTWKLKIVTLNNTEISWLQAATRFLAALLSWACCGLGFIWIVFNKEKRSWHDLASDTRVIRL
jgi:uncharacterized RDD family membrane protein YckC